VSDTRTPEELMATIAQLRGELTETRAWWRKKAQQVNAQLLSALAERDQALAILATIHDVIHQLSGPDEGKS
jgi:hypothetical protein